MANEERIIDRIRKMLALANDLAATEGERDNALRMAYATMAKYNIDMAKVEASGNGEPRIDFESKGWSWAWTHGVRTIVGDLFMCKYYWRNSPGSGKINGTQCMHNFIGRESNAMTAAVMSDYVVDSILKEGRKIYKQNTAPGTRSFAIGAMHRLHERVREIKRSQAVQSEAESAGTALVLASLYKTEQDANQTVLDELETRKSKGASTNNIDGSAYVKGREYGGKINLSAQVSGSTKGSAKLK